jgi:predicted transposase YbfD/YdcC
MDRERDDEGFAGFLGSFAGLPDGRKACRIQHSVSELLLVAFCGMVCGANNWTEMAMIGEGKLDYLREYLPYAHGAPCKDTLRRFFRTLDPASFQERFVAWARALHGGVADKIIAIDGKTSRHSVDGGATPLHLVSAFASEARLVLGQQAVQHKSNEISAIPLLLDMLALEGAIITIDAMGCQHSIAEKIRHKDGQYLLALKGNQSTLHDDVKGYFDTAASLSTARSHTDTSEGHGRLETRTCHVRDDIDWLKNRHPHWHSLKTIVCIETIRQSKDLITTEKRYFITSLPPAPEKILHTVRSHWAIENALHWSLDVTMLDDANRTRKDNAPLNIAILRHIALNTLKSLKPPKMSLSLFRKAVGWNQKEFLYFVENLHKVF